MKILLYYPTFTLIIPLRDNVSYGLPSLLILHSLLNWTTANMNEMIINILTVGPSSIEITLPTGEMKSLKNWGMDLYSFRP